MRPIELCLESLTATVQYTRCIALVGRQPGLRLSCDGTLLWMNDQNAAVELWVSADSKLIAYRLDASPEIVLRRSGRSLVLPPRKPVVVVNRDTLESDAWCYRIHVHGVAARVLEPERVDPAPRRLFRATAAALTVAAIGSTTTLMHGQEAGPGAADASASDAEAEADVQDEPIDVRENPPAPITDPPEKLEPATLCSTSTPGRKR